MIIFLKRIRIHYSIIILSILALYVGKYREIIILLSLLLLHELSHIFFMKIFKQKISLVTITAIGGIIDVESQAGKYQELLIYSSGIFINLILYLIFFNSKGEYASILFDYNRLILIFNSLPIIPLDGSKILEVIFDLIFKPRISSKLILFISIISLIILLSYSFLNKSIIFLAIGIFLIYRNICYYNNLDNIILKKIIIKMSRGPYDNTK